MLGLRTISTSILITQYFSEALSLNIFSNNRKGITSSNIFNNNKIMPKSGTRSNATLDKTPIDNTNTTEERRQYFLMKSEPHEFSISDLKARKHMQEEWDGVRNYEARNILRSMNVNDLAFFYHSNVNKNNPELGPGIVGVVSIARGAIPDVTAMDPKHKNYDSKIGSTSIDKCRWSSVLVKLEYEFPVVLSLKDIKEEASREPDGQIAKMDLLRRNRLSVTRVTKEQWEAVESMIEAKAAQEA